MSVEIDPAAPRLREFRGKPALREGRESVIVVDDLM
jgi:hypothetical protein